MKSVGLSTPLHLQFVLQDDSEGIGYVRYRTGGGQIQIRRMAEKELRRVPGGRPSEIESRWSEITSDGLGGTYVVVSQGARISDFRYLRKDGRTFRFEEEPDASTDSGCVWK